MNTSKMKFCKVGTVFWLVFSVSLPVFPLFPEASKTLPGVTVLGAENLTLKGVEVFNNPAVKNGKAVKIL